MKKLIIACFVFLGFALASCLDTEETITVKEDNSGTYQLTMAIGNSPMLQGALQQSGQTLEKKDTVIYFKGFTDTATTLSAEEKSILENGKLHLAMNGDIKAAFELPFKNMDQLLYIKQHMFEMISKIRPQNSDDSSAASMFSGMDMMGGGGAQGMEGAGKLLNPTRDAFDFAISHNMISNKIKDKASLTEAFGSDSMQMIKQMLPMIGDLNYTTTFVLPSPVKHYSGGADSKLSDDKKTITFINSLSGLLDKPESLEYTVEY
ncbi:hypothetical protein FRZ67_16245 [Panacibacter ginsenosidivorans]|uniref:Lipoprotein n=1 Tax=Panacibacter ginsenosidivorans TaxID=1813871 RepID=A0A5B8VBB6_9BACT|nr:hypothetical protein [Panacibacter ginsenosidivorans]QEC68780.1 hypothetical protein FRZ67_16245 [Panacibacter ginsenosidivorans]